MVFSDFTLSALRHLLAPIHLLAYSALLGTELYQTFVITKVAYQALPRSAFTSLQRRLFPVYFQSQTALVVVTALSCPPYGPASLIQVKLAWIPFVVAGVTAGLNLLVYGPRTRGVMMERIHQETRDKRSGIAEGMVSEEMRIMNRAFSRAHAMSIHLNLMTIGATLLYGWKLASMLTLDVGAP